MSEHADMVYLCLAVAVARCFADADRCCTVRDARQHTDPNMRCALHWFVVISSLGCVDVRVMRRDMAAAFVEVGFYVFVWQL